MFQRVKSLIYGFCKLLWQTTKFVFNIIWQTTKFVFNISGIYFFASLNPQFLAEKLKEYYQSKHQEPGFWVSLLPWRNDYFDTLKQIDAFPFHFILRSIAFLWGAYYFYGTAKNVLSAIFKRQPPKPCVEKGTCSGAKPAAETKLPEKEITPKPPEKPEEPIQGKPVTHQFRRKNRFRLQRPEGGSRPILIISSDKKHKKHKK